MAGRLIIIEGGDGSGKATQSELLYRQLAADHYPVRKIEFPNYQSPSSALVKMYLNGEFGEDPAMINPYAAAAFFAVDRFASYQTDWGEFYRTGGIVVADRYVTSNMVHQAVKLPTAGERRAFIRWVEDLEFNRFGLPAPDLVIFLDLPPAYSEHLLQERQARTGGPGDIHERDREYLGRCYRTYRETAGAYGWQPVNCLDDQGRLRPAGAIQADIYRLVGNIIFADR